MVRHYKSSTFWSPRMLLSLFASVYDRPGHGRILLQRLLLRLLQSCLALWSPSFHEGKREHTGKSELRCFHYFRMSESLLLHMRTCSVGARGEVCQKHENVFLIPITEI
ncbi:uncharacterized protein LOC106071589 isoform X2 [Biomphalaria glabrata]|uniref:Uncharacterized protein LOC106071589 isoform X2 n=1 Tax=Biomphalaria glabrata TaxID=6526 RepID=A0A9U8EGV5_BIOGL|nr:uncharacterized protein LOC106071589 isoform X2 [Biomphalaria glabrata]